jgi:adenine-specific DNA methylase
MSEKPTSESDRQSLKIEGLLPVKAVGIECMKESNPETMSPHRYLHKWFARRPTAATRLAVLSSILPEDVTNDELLELMQVAPRNSEHLSTSISKYVEQKYATWESGSNDSLSDHYGYDLPLKQTPSDEELAEFHETLIEGWGDLPTVLDPTAGGGTIPLEALRYGLPVRANELNSVAWLLNKVILEYASQVGSLENELNHWAEEINNKADKKLSEYFPSSRGDRRPSYYFCTYSIECPSCGYRLPLSNRWWFNKDTASKGHAIRPHPKKDRIEFEHVVLPDDVKKSEFDPSEGTVSRGDAECINCGVVTESETVKERLQDGAFEYELCGVKYVNDGKGSRSGYRAATDEDRDAFSKAAEAVESDISLATLLSTKVPKGKKTNEARSYGIAQWRDMYTPRQLLTHAKYKDAFEEVKPEIQGRYDDKKAKAIITLLTFGASKMVNRNSRLSPLNIAYAAPETVMGNNNYSFSWQFCENNHLAGNTSYMENMQSRRGVINCYEKVVDFVKHIEEPDVQVSHGDASRLSCEDSSIQAVVVDPPYGDNIMYSELADFFYVWQKEYLQNTFPQQFATDLSDKESEAVENISKFDEADVEAANADSRTELAEQYYESKMSDIFNECYRALEPGGVLTIYFTEKETEAWDALTMSLINSGFTISATHPITSEMTHRIGMQGSASADTTLLLTCRKPVNPTPPEERQRTLWDSIEEETHTVAVEKATELLDSDLSLTKTDTIISAFGPTLRVFTENYPVVDKHGDPVRPRDALQEARSAVVDVLLDRELEHTLDGVDSLTKWYLLSWLVYERETIPHDEARQLGIGVGVHIDEIKRDTKIWGKSGEDVILKGQADRVQDFDKLKGGAKRRKRKYPVNPQDVHFDYDINAVHSALNVLDTEGGNTTWNWLKDRNLGDDPVFRRTVKTLIKVLPEGHEDHELLSDLIVGKTGDLLDIDVQVFEHREETEGKSLSDYGA